MLCSLKNEADWVQEPRGRALIKFIAEKATINQIAIARKINELEELKYIEKEFRGHQEKILWRVKILTDSWDETRLTEKHERENIALEAGRTEQEAKAPTAVALTNLKPELVKATTEKKFAIFMDYSNLEKICRERQTASVIFLGY